MVAVTCVSLVISNFDHLFIAVAICIALECSAHFNQVVRFSVELYEFFLIYILDINP